MTSVKITLRQHLFPSLEAWQSSMEVCLPEVAFRRCSWDAGFRWKNILGPGKSNISSRVLLFSYFYTGRTLFNLRVLLISVRIGNPFHLIFLRCRSFDIETVAS
jgi:hypothetical protein